MAVVSIAAAFQQAFAHEAAGREREAMAVYRSILAAVPNHPGALLRIAESEIRGGDRDRGRARLRLAMDSARAMRLPAADIIVALARLDRSEGRVAEARAALEGALEEEPGHPTAMLELGAIAAAGGDLAKAAELFLAVTQHLPDSGSAWLQLAFLAERQGLLAQAREAAAKAVAARHTSAAAFEHAARLALRMGDTASADALCRAGLARYTRAPDLLHQHGIVLKTMGNRQAAYASLERAVGLAPDDSGLRLTASATCLDAGHAAEAQRHLEHAIALGDTRGEVWDNLGLARRALGDLEGAAEAFAHAVAVAPGLTPALANLVQSRQQNCDWDGLDALEETLAATIDDPSSDPCLPPFVTLSMPLTPAQQLKVARRWSRATLPGVASHPPPHPRGERLRVGYLASDFRDHAMGRLMVGLFEAHDRAGFEIIAYSHGPDDASPLRARIREAFDVWRDVAGLPDCDLAERIRADGIDVLVECNGHTTGGRLAVLASRPAPVQLHYIGFPGTLGYDGIDGIVADDTVVPPGAEPDFHETVWRLPRCYFVNDSQRQVPHQADRAEHGLPRDALVLACFNQPYKITRPMFRMWMEALASSPNAVLWLLRATSVQERNLRREAQASAIDPARIIFAPLVAQDAHMRRVGCADLTLDTLPYGQHTTACDALWAGVPMLTCRGTTFVGRVGASIMRAAELPELITGSMAEYRDRLLAFTREPGALARYREHLVTHRHRLPLFDTAAFARDWEALLLESYAATIATRAG